MKVKYWMTKNPVTIAPDASVNEAVRIMKEHDFRRLPVMENGRLMGLVTYRNILEAQPSAVSTLSVHEARYLVDKLKVSDVMRKNPLTVSPDDDVIAAMIEGQRKGLGAYPVVENGILVGIVTTSDLFDLVVHILGSAAQSDFIYLTDKMEKFEETDFVPRLITLLAAHGITLQSYLVFPRKETAGSSIMLLKITPGRQRETVDLLLTSGFTVLD